MDKVRTINYFSTFGSNLPYVLKEENNRYVPIRNLNFNPNFPFLDGAYFELLQGNIANPSGLNQNFVFRLRNPNNLNLSSSYVFRVYNPTTNAIVHETFLPSNFDGMTVSYSSNAQNLVFTLESSSNVLYSSIDLLNGYIPLDQRFVAVFYDLNNQEIFRSYLFRQLNSLVFFVPKNYRSTQARTIANVFLPVNRVYLFYLSTQLASTGEEITTEFKFPNQYLFVGNNLNYYLSSYSILLLLFLRDFASTFWGSSISATLNYANLDKYLGKLPYKEYLYNKSTLTYERTSNFVDIEEILLALSSTIVSRGLLVSTRQIYDNILDALYNFAYTNFYPGSPSFSSNVLIPDFIDSGVEEQYSLATNLLFINLLDKLNINYQNLLQEVNSKFVAQNRKKINRQLGDITTFSPLEAAIISKLGQRYLDTTNPYVSSLIASANSFLSTSVEYLTLVPISTDATTNQYNPLYSLAFSSALPFYDPRTYVNLFILSLLETSIVNFGEFSVNGSILDSYKFNSGEKLFILPSLRANLSYIFLSLQNFFTENLNQEEDEFLVLDYSATLVGNILTLNVTVNKQTKLLLNIVASGRPYAYSVSNSVSFNHSFVIDISGIPSNYKIELYPIKD